jgi:hypothetical protein
MIAVILWLVISVAFLIFVKRRFNKWRENRAFDKQRDERQAALDWWHSLSSEEKLDVLERKENCDRIAAQQEEYDNESYEESYEDSYEEPETSSSYQAPTRTEPKRAQQSPHKPLPKPAAPKKADWYRVQRFNGNYWQNVGAATNMFRNAEQSMRQMQSVYANADTKRTGIRYRVVNTTTGSTEMSD